MCFSESNKSSASALASSVLPTPVGPRNMNEPSGLEGSWSPALERSTASATASTASSCPMTRSCKVSAKCKSFCLSPWTSLATGMPVMRLTTSAISFSVTDSSTSQSSGRFVFSSSSSSLSSFGMTACCKRAASSRSYLFSASSRSCLALSISCFLSETFWMSSFSLSQRILSLFARSRDSARSSWSSAKRFFEAGSFSFFKAASSTSCLISWRVTWSSSVGIEFISTLISAHASSIRSIALSGRKRSVT